MGRLLSDTFNQMIWILFLFAFAYDIDYSKSTQENYNLEGKQFHGKYVDVRESLDFNYHGNYIEVRQHFQVKIVENF